MRWQTNWVWVPCDTILVQLRKTCRRLDEPDAGSTRSAMSSTRDCWWSGVWVAIRESIQWFVQVARWNVTLSRFVLCTRTYTIARLCSEQSFHVDRGEESSEVVRTNWTREQWHVRVSDGLRAWLKVTRLCGSRTNNALGRGSAQERTSEWKKRRMIGANGSQALVSNNTEFQVGISRERCGRIGSTQMIIFI